MGQIATTLMIGWKMDSMMGSIARRIEEVEHVECFSQNCCNFNFHIKYFIKEKTQIKLTLGVENATTIV